MRLKYVLSIVLLTILTSCHVGRFFIYNFADVRDHKKFPSRTIRPADTAFHFLNVTTARIKVCPDTVLLKKQKVSLEKAFTKTKTIAFLVIRNDSLLYEWYAKENSREKVVPSFSMAKSYISALIGIAISEGYIKSTNDPITNYLSFKHQKDFEKITIQHLLDMRSGIAFNESYINPFGDVAKFYYGRKLKKYSYHLKIKEEPGKNFEYISVNTQLLGLILEKATGRTVTHYFEEKIWTKIGTEMNATWSLDSRKFKTEKTFCCLNARAKDYAKFGRLYLKNGKWNGKQIVPENWVKQSVTFSEYKNYFLYSNQWWHTRNYFPLSDSLKTPALREVISYKDKEGKNRQVYMCPSGDFFAEGILGQFIYVNPKTSTIIVRLGKKEGSLHWAGLFKQISK